MRNISDRSCREKQNTYFIGNNFIRKSIVYEVKWGKNCTVGPATDESMTHEHYMPDT